MEGVEVTPEFWIDKRILVTGHTGFKGVWATRLLAHLGAEIHGLALAPNTDPSLSQMLGEKYLASSTIGNITNRKVVDQVVTKIAPRIVLHLAAQSLVRYAYRKPVETISTNVMGTVYLLDVLRELNDVDTVLVVTTDKVYENQEDDRAFVENDRLGGHDPYAGSKAATELVTSALNRSYFLPRGIKLATARGGNVIGGGDFSEDRLIPDIVRAEMTGASLTLRNPQATRPWQHVLDCLSGYLTYIQKLSEGHNLPPTLNFGPTDSDEHLTVAQVQAAFSSKFSPAQNWKPDTSTAPHEMQTLAINADAAQRLLGWENQYSPSEAIHLTAEWYQAWRNGADPKVLLDAQIAAFLKLSEKSKP